MSNLPFLKHKPAASGGVITTVRKPDGSRQEQDPTEDDGLKAAAADLIRAINNKDEDATAAAMKAAFTILDAQPHEEGPHESESDQE